MYCRGYGQYLLKLNRDLPLDREWFSGSFILSRGHNSKLTSRQWWCTGVRGGLGALAGAPHDLYVQLLASNSLWSVTCITLASQWRNSSLADLCRFLFSFNLNGVSFRNVEQDNNFHKSCGNSVTPPPSGGQSNLRDFQLSFCVDHGK